MEMRLLMRRHLTALAIVVVTLVTGSGISRAQNNEVRSDSRTVELSRRVGLTQ